eukprot:4849397-Pyramimonas_sp.AAC.1
MSRPPSVGTPNLDCTLTWAISWMNASSRNSKDRMIGPVAPPSPQIQLNRIWGTVWNSATATLSAVVSTLRVLGILVLLVARLRLGRGVSGRLGRRGRGALCGLRRA